MANITYDLIATYSIPSATTSYTFTSIPSTYVDLVLIGNVTSASEYGLQFNSDTGSSYSSAEFWGPNGSATYSEPNSGTKLNLRSADALITSPNPFVANILSYKNTNVYKRVLAETNDGRYGRAYRITGQWRNTSAINSITIVSSTNGLVAGCWFSLYGIAAAV